MLLILEIAFLQRNRTLPGQIFSRPAHNSLPRRETEKKREKKYQYGSVQQYICMTTTYSIPGVLQLFVVVVDSHIQRIVLATEETTVTQQVSHNRPIKCQCRLWSQRGTKVNGSQPTHDQRSQQQSGEITLQPVLINKFKFFKATHVQK